jgi:hypothetical protein
MKEMNNWKDKTCITLMQEIVERQKQAEQEKKKWVETMKVLVLNPEVQKALDYLKDK